MDVNKYINRVNEITDSLEKDASSKKNIEYVKSNAYYEGYHQACEDFAKWIMVELPNWLNKAREEG